MISQCVILDTLYWNMRELTAKLPNSYECNFNSKDTKTMPATSIDTALVSLLSTLNIFFLVPIPQAVL